jgi:hypothetical protein
MPKQTKISFVTSVLPPKALKKVNLEPMSAEEVQLLRSFLQREIDVIRADMKEARDESTVAHNEVKEQLKGVRDDIAALDNRVHYVEKHEETQDHADIARKEVKDSLRRSFLAANAVLGTAIVVVIYLIDKL